MDGVRLRVVANNRSWEGVSVIGQAVGYCNNQKFVTDFGPVRTNSTGWASFPGGGWPGFWPSLDYFKRGFP